MIEFYNNPETKCKCFVGYPLFREVPKRFGTRPISMENNFSTDQGVGKVISDSCSTLHLLCTSFLI